MFFRRHLPLADLAPRRICLVKPSALGDVVQSLPILSALRARWPQAHIAWVIHRGLAGLLAGHPELNECIEFDRSARGMRRLSAARQLARRLRQGQFDLVVDLQGLLRTGLMTLATGASRRVGFANAREGARFAYTDRVAVPTREMPAVDRYWLVARALGCSGEPPAARLGLTPALRAWAAEQVRSLPRPVLAIHPGAQWITKRWPTEHFASIARRAQAELGAGVLLVSGPGEGALAAQIEAEISGPTLNLAERTSLLQLAALVEAADVQLSGDTGPMHLAAAMGTPVVALYTCTSPVRARPHGPGHRVVATQVECRASYVRHCPTMHCMGELTPARVWPAVRAALAEAAPPAASKAG